MENPFPSFQQQEEGSAGHNMFVATIDEIRRQKKQRSTAAEVEYSDILSDPRIGLIYEGFIHIKRYQESKVLSRHYDEVTKDAPMGDPHDQAAALERMEAEEGLDEILDEDGLIDVDDL